MPENEAVQFEEFVDRLGLRHFRGSEFTKFWGASTNGITNSVPPAALWPNIIRTLIVLDELRENLGAPIALNSTYRSPAYNSAVGGEPASFHMEFRAVDFHCDAGDPAHWAAVLRQWRGHSFNLPGNGGAFEFRGGVGHYNTFVHVDTRGYDADW